MDQATELRELVRQQNIIDEKKTARVLTITSGKGGVGKSNTTVNLAVQLSKLGKKVIIFDADIGLANVEVMFGAIPKHSLSDVIFRGMSISDVITPGPLDIGFISGGSGVVGLSNITKEQIMFLVHNLSELDNKADFILIDTGAGISDVVMDFVLASPEILLVTTPEPSSLTDSYSLLKTLYRHPLFKANEASINVIANRVNSTADGQGVFDKLNAVASQFLNANINYLGLVPQDSAIEKAVRAQKTVSLFDPNSPSAKAYEMLAHNLVSDDKQVYKVKGGLTKLLYGFINKR